MKNDNLLKKQEIRSMAGVLLKESAMIKARCKILEDMAHSETNPVKIIDYTAEVLMLSSIVDVLEDMTESTLKEFENIK